MSIAYEQRCQEDARLAILVELSQQIDGSLNSLNLHRMLDAADVRRPREWVETQISMLQQLGAVTVRTVELPGRGLVMTATITEQGRNHVERRSRIYGVSAPADGY